ncbi:MAG: glycosyltransferase [Terriglobales bacterium]
MPTVWLEMQKLDVAASGLGEVCAGLEAALERQAPAALTLHSYRPRHRTRDRWLGAAAPGCDLWHAMHQDRPYLPRRREAPVLLTIHDLNFLLPGAAPGRQRARLGRLQKLVDRAAALTAVSEFTAGVVRQHVELGGKSLTVIPNGNPLDPAVAGERPPWAPEAPFLLALAHVHPKKNLAVLLPLLTRQRDWCLVLAGDTRHPYAAEVRREAKRLGVAARLLLPGVVRPSAKRWLLEHCTAFTLPSLAEGFGLPVLEAMSLGKALFLAERCSLPEVGGPDAFYWTDFDPEHMGAVLDQGLAAFAADPDRAQRLRRRAAQFTWDAAARQYLSLYLQLVR